MYMNRPFGIEETHGMLNLPGVDFRSTSNGKDWTSVFASVQRERPFEGVFGPSRDQLLVLHRDGPVEIENILDRRAGSRIVPAGSIHLVSSGEQFGINLKETVETAHVYIRRAIIEEVAAELAESDPTKIIIRSGVMMNATLRSLIEATAFALEDDSTASGMFVDYLSRAIAAQLIRNHSNAKLKPVNGFMKVSRVSPALSEVIDFMSSNIDATINLSDLAGATNRSPSHIARMFRSELGMPPHQFLIKLRIDRARNLLEKSTMSIAEIAYECGFSHQEHLTRLFRRHLDTTPAAYRRSKRN
jgi:AraC family transcriptional regulator